MSKPFSKEQSTRHAPKEEKVKKERKPIPKMSEKKKAELEDRKTWSIGQFKKAQKETKKEKENRIDKPRKTPLTKIKKDLDVIYSCVVRMGPSNSEGITFCVTCQKNVHWSKLQNGHFIKRSIAPSLIFNRANTAPQCLRCNVLLEGNRLAYVRHMEALYGKEFVYMLEMAGQNKSNNGAFEYQIMLQEYIELFLIQCKRLNHTPTKAQQKIVDKWK